MKKILTIGLVSLFFLPVNASAHAFGQLYNLPVPFWMYLYGGAAAIIISFLVIGYFFGKTDQEFTYQSKPLFRLNSVFINTLKTIGVIFFLLTVLSGLVGRDSSVTNFNMTFFWIIFALGLTYLVAIIGNIYTFLNPWKIIISWFGFEKGIFNYPKWFSYYPALIFYFLFIWLELVGDTSPSKLSIVLILYSLLTFTGVVTFGKENWFRYGEFFSVFFRLMGRIAPIEYRDGNLYLRPLFSGLIKEKAEHFSLLLFILFMLSSTAFDGFRETITWVRFYWQNFDSILNSFATFDTLGILISPFVFLAIYLILIWLAKLVTKSTDSLYDLALRFAFTLIPIALAYNLAHYYTLIFTEAPNIIRLISDPFGSGLNLFGTAEFYGRIILRANFVWHSQVAFILLGHIAGVYLAHVIALNIFPSTKKALASQVPMLVLMVIYTMIGLWILSQPITGGTL